MNSEEEIRRVIAELGRSIEARDYDGAAACFAHDAVLMLPGSAMVRGEGAIRSALAAMFRRCEGAWKITVDIHNADDVI